MKAMKILIKINDQMYQTRYAFSNSCSSCDLWNACSTQTDGPIYIIGICMSIDDQFPMPIEWEKVEKEK